MSVINSMYCINKIIFYLHNYVDRISKEILNGLGGQVKITVDPILTISSQKINVSVEFKFTYNIFLFISQQVLLSR
jgi:hypothetical protein